MKINKFNIGQKVIVIDGRRVVEKIVTNISSSKDEIIYELINQDNDVVTCRARDHYTDWLNYYLVKPTPSMRNWGRNPNAYDTIVLDDVDTKTYKESEIFIDEADFRSNVKIKRPEPTKEELVEKLKKYATDLSDGNAPKQIAGDIADLVNKIHK
jgi:hypothetical protein